MFYAVYKNEDNFELWSDKFSSENPALLQAELRVLDTYGSRSKEYMRRINGLRAIDEHTARHLKLIN
jgi:hypothetical protein